MSARRTQRVYDTKNLYGLSESMATQKALYGSTGKRGAVISRRLFQKRLLSDANDIIKLYFAMEIVHNFCSQKGRAEKFYETYQIFHSCCLRELTKKERLWHLVDTKYTQILKGIYFIAKRSFVNFLNYKCPTPFPLHYRGGEGEEGAVDCRNEFAKIC